MKYFSTFPYLYNCIFAYLYYVYCIQKINLAQMIVLFEECKYAVTTVGLYKYGCMHGQVVSLEPRVDLTLQGVCSDVFHTSEKAVSLHPSTAAQRLLTSHVY